MTQWQLQEAKAKLSEVIKMALSKGPQHITVRGKEEAVLLSKADYDKLTRKNQTLVSFMRSSPLCGLDLDITRDTSSMRDIEL